MFLTDPARRRRQTRAQIVFAVVMVIAVRLIVVLASKPHAEVATPPATPAPAVAPVVAAPAAAAPTSLIDEPLVKLVAASDAPVIAVASEHRVWISRDDGKTFALALQGTASISDLLVEPSGRVYVVRFTTRDHRAANGVTYVQSQSELGIAELDGRERWHELADGMVPWVARDGRIAGVASGGVEIGQNAGDSWSTVPGSTPWNPWAIALGEPGTVRFLASRTGKNDQLEAAISVVVAHDGRPAAVVWSTRLAGVGAPAEETPCSGFAGQVLHVVTTDARAGARGTRLLRVDRDGKVRTRVLDDLVGGVVLDPGLSCEIAGNEHAAYLALDNVLFRLDTREPQVSEHHSDEIRAIAVDAHGDLVVLAHRCVRRLYAGSMREDELVCGPEPQ